MAGACLRKISLVIFDCDGVLVDSEYLSAQVLVETFAEIGVNIDLPFVYTHFLGHSFSSVAAKFAKLHGTGVTESFETDYRASLLRRFSSELKPMPGVIAVLDSLAVPYCVATGSSPLRVTRSLELTGLTSRVKDRVFTTSMVTQRQTGPGHLPPCRPGNGDIPAGMPGDRGQRLRGRGGKGGGNGGLAVCRRLSFPARL